MQKKMPLYNIEKISIFYKNSPTYNPQGLLKINPKEVKNGNTHKVKTVKGESAINGGRFKDSYIQEYTNYPKQILTFPRERGLHPTQKPVELMKYLIKTYTNKGEIILDFTMGSGTTGVAVEELNRDEDYNLSFYGIELDEGYFNIAKERIEKV